MMQTRTNGYQKLLLGMAITSVSCTCPSGRRMPRCDIYASSSVLPTSTVLLTMTAFSTAFNAHAQCKRAHHLVVHHAMSSVVPKTAPFGL